MDVVFRWIESSAFSTWTRESTSVFVFPGFLSAHALGMALAVGVNAALAFVVMGLTPGVPLREMRSYAAVMWFGFWLNAASGLVLLIAYPTKALTNPVFYVKITLIGVAMRIFVVLDRRVRDGVEAGSGKESQAMRRLAVASLLCWGGAIFAGRLLAYTFRRMSVNW